MASPLPIARFRPRLIDCLQGYDRARFAKDVAAGLTGGVVALPLLSRLYVRDKDLPKIRQDHRPGFRTKLELAVELRTRSGRVKSTEDSDQEERYVAGALLVF